jgi:hypothetical protein
MRAEAAAEETTTAAAAAAPATAAAATAAAPIAFTRLSSPPPGFASPVAVTAATAVSPAAAAASLAVQLAEPVEIDPQYRTDVGLSGAFAAFATHGDMLDAAGWERVVRSCGLVGGVLTDAMAREIFVQSGAPLNVEGGHMGWDEFLWACAVVGGTHGVMFKIVAQRVLSVAERQETARRVEAEERGGGGEQQVVGRTAPPPPEKPTLLTKKKSRSMFSMFKK